MAEKLVSLLNIKWVLGLLGSKSVPRLRPFSIPKTGDERSRERWLIQYDHHVEEEQRGLVSTNTHRDLVHLCGTDVRFRFKR